MSDTPRTDDIWYDPSRKYNGQLASSLYDLCRDLERENTVLCEKWRMAEDQCFDQVGKIGDLERENAALRADKKRLDWLERRTVSRLQAVLDHVELHKLPIREAIDLSIEEIGQ